MSFWKNDKQFSRFRCRTKIDFPVKHFWTKIPPNRVMSASLPNDLQSSKSIWDPQISAKFPGLALRQNFMSKNLNHPQKNIVVLEFSIQKAIHRIQLRRTHTKAPANLSFQKKKFSRSHHVRQNDCNHRQRILNENLSQNRDPAYRS